jgi:hypothetical protein
MYEAKHLYVNRENSLELYNNYIIKKDKMQEKISEDNK